jgi:orotate phosphoribosyltransferase
MAENVVAMFEKSGALLKGHFLYASGLHGPVYWEKAKVIQYPEYTEKLCKMIADHYRKAGATIVAGPTTPGIILSYVTARHLGVRSIFAEKNEAEGIREFRRGFEIVPGEKVLVVDDVMTTGGSVREVIDAVRKLGGNVIGSACLFIAPLPSRWISACLFIAATARKRSPTLPRNAPCAAQGIPLERRGSSIAKTG